MKTDDLTELVLTCLKRVAPEVDVDKLDAHRTFQEQINFDLVDFLSFIMTLEESLGVRISEVDFPKLSNLEGCISYLSTVGRRP